MMMLGENSHKYQQLPLIPEDQFLAERPKLQCTDENTVMVARIEHELAEREALEAERQGLLKKKQGLIADNKKRKEDLASLDQDLEKFIDVSGEASVGRQRVDKIVWADQECRLRNRSRRFLRRSIDGREFG